MVRSQAMVEEEHPGPASNEDTAAPMDVDGGADLLDFADSIAMLEKQEDAGALAGSGGANGLKQGAQKGQADTNGKDPASSNGQVEIVEHADNGKLQLGRIPEGLQNDSGPVFLGQGWREEEVRDFFAAYKANKTDWNQISLTTARDVKEIGNFYELTSAYLTLEEASSEGLCEFYKAAVEGKSGKAEVATPAKRAMGSAGANAAEGKMVWASSGKRSDRKKRPAQQVRPVISPDKPKPKSPDVLMTSVIETLAQAASVSRSNPGTPQSKLEQTSGAQKAAGRNGHGGKGNQSPKPRKRLFADDGMAASALLGLASTSNQESTGQPRQKRGKTSRPTTPKSTPRKQHKTLMDSLRSQPLKEISGLGPQVKPRNRRKAEHRRYLGPLSPLMKLHKRFSTFKSASSSPNAKVLERQLKLQSSLDGLLGWGEKTQAPPGSVLGKIQNCLTPSMRRWCYYEWFYSSIDKLWFEKNKFQDFLDHAGISKCKSLQRAEWAMIRRSLGKPRRLSLQFLHEERAELEAYRAGVRKHFKDKDPSEIPADMPRPLVVGQRVTARHPVTRQIHDGSILTVDHSNSKYRVQFDRQELGVQQLEDVHIMARTSTETTPLVPIRKPKLEPLNVSEPAMFTPRRQGGLTSIPEAEPAGVIACTPSNQVDSREIDMRSLAQVDMLLDLKQRLLGDLRQMNDEAEGNLHLDENGCTSKQFQQNYALLVRKLRECNDRLKSALVRLQQRVQVSQYRLVSQVFVQNPSQQLIQSPLLQVHKLSTNDIIQHAKTIIAEAQSTGVTKSKGGKKKQRGKASDKQAKAKVEEEQRIKDLISNCVNFMYLLQICADRSLPSEAVNMAVDMLLQQLKPKSDKNRTLYNEIKKSIGIIKTQLTSY